jgi:hypothetical protein
MADEFDLSDLIAAPIRALNEAEAAAATRFLELLLDYALEHPTEDPAAAAARPAAGADAAQAEATPTPRLRQFTFDMERVDPDGVTRTHRLSVPLFQLLPFGGVSIDQATLNYGVTLRAARPSGPSVGRVPAVAAPPASRFSGRLAQSRGNSSPGAPASDANLDIEVKLRQIDVPQGLLDLIQHTQGIVRSEAPPADRQEPPPASDGKLFTVESRGIGRDARSTDKFTLVLRITPRQKLAGPLILTFAETPAKAFSLAVVRGATSITTRTDVVLSLSGFNADRLAMLAAGRLGVTIGGTSIDAPSQAQVDHTVLVVLAPQQSTGTSR